MEWSGVEWIVLCEQDPVYKGPVIREQSELLNAAMCKLGGPPSVVNGNSV
jgi:hypothetical protein